MCVYVCVCVSMDVCVCVCVCLCVCADRSEWFGKGCKRSALNISIMSLAVTKIPENMRHSLHDERVHTKDERDRIPSHISGGISMSRMNRSSNMVTASS